MKPITRIPDKDNPYFNGVVANATVTVGTEAAHAINVAIQLLGPDYRDIAEGAKIEAYLSDDSGGNSIAASAPSSGWAIGTDGLLIPVVANKAAWLISESDGDIDITITEATLKTFYLVLCLPGAKRVITTVAFAG